ncbi:hypothetical protein [Exiguobacterium aurantiacum]|uniref:Uncharacterized protein n=1 Tax=Exiguobacterium aurantiacum TaxID=33987 RepID=A0ABY5FJW6_9BACL|nr:hypothetical protein [Exiguobacterium aurantiacum]UTT41597.1 hypothetical protein NMQ00_08445 [Exiguobacterium aurantiacum]
MNQVYPNQQRTKKRYLYAFLLLALFNTVLHAYDTGSVASSPFQLVGGLVFYTTLLYFGLKEIRWAEIAIKFVVWLNVIVLFIILLFMGLSLFA